MATCPGRLEVRLAGPIVEGETHVTSYLPGHGQDPRSSDADTPSGEQHPTGHHPSGQYPSGGHPSDQRPYGQHPYGQPPYGQHPSGQNPYGQSPYGQVPYGQSPYGQSPYGANPYGQAPYGHNPYGQAPYSSPPADPRKHGGMATAALVLGIIGFVFAVIPGVNFAAYPLVILAIIFGIVGWAWGKGKAGLILGALGLVATVVWTILIVAVVHHVSHCETYQDGARTCSYSTT